MVEVWNAVLAEVKSQGEAVLREQSFNISRSSGKRKQEGEEGQASVTTTNTSRELHAPHILSPSESMFLLVLNEPKALGQI